MQELYEHRNLDKSHPRLSPPGGTRFRLERTPFPDRPHVSLEADGITAQISPVDLPDESGTRCDAGDPAISVAILGSGPPPVEVS